MREILFRGKTKRDTWVEGYLVDGKWYMDDSRLTVIIPTDARFYPRCEIDGWEDVIPETVGQFTGLLDKNGKKIFEGDIVEYEAHGYIPYVKRGVVIFNNGYFGIEYDCSISRSDRPPMTIHQIGKTTEWQDMGASGTITYTYEIIGNIHDNPELLGVK